MIIHRLRLREFPAAREYRDRVRHRAHRDRRTRTGPERRRCSRRSPGRCTACRPRAGTGRASAAAARAPRAGVEVELEFSLGAHRYRVVRTLRGAELYQDATLRRSPTARAGHRAGHAAHGHDVARSSSTPTSPAEGARGHGGDDADGAGPVPLPRAGIRAAPHRAGPAHSDERTALRARLDTLRRGAARSRGSTRRRRGRRTRCAAAEARVAEAREAGADRRIAGTPSSGRGGRRRSSCARPPRHSMRKLAWPSSRTWKRRGRRRAAGRELRGGNGRGSGSTELETILAPLRGAA